jgi:hypothetical protein
VALQQVDELLRQAVLDEWDARCRNSAVRNPAGYLFGIIQKAIRGEFKAWAGEGRTRTLCTSTACSKRPWPRGGASLPGEAAFGARRFLSSYPQGMAGTSSLPADGRWFVAHHVVATRCRPIPRG